MNKTEGAASAAHKYGRANGSNIYGYINDVPQYYIPSSRTVEETLADYDRALNDCFDGRFKRETMTDADFDAIFEELILDCKKWAGFPIGSVPAVLRDIAVSIATTHKAYDKIGVITLPFIGFFAASLGQGICVKTRKFRSFGNLYVYCSVGSGGIKSVAFEEAERPMMSSQAYLADYHKTRVVPEARGKIKSTEKKIELADDDELTQLYSELQTERDRLKFVSIRLDDITPESMTDTAIDCGRVFIASDEATIISDIIGGRYSKGFSNEGPFCKLWSNSYLGRLRGAGSSDVKVNVFRNNCIGSMVLMGQEHITEQMFNNPTMVQSGFIPRFLFDEADTPMQLRGSILDTQPLDDKAQSNYADAISKAVEDYWPLDREKNEDGIKQEPLEIQMDLDAQQELNNFHDRWVNSANTNLIDARRQLHRIAEQATRVALVFHVAKAYGHKLGLESDVKAVEDPINLQTVNEAISIVEYSLGKFLAHTQGKREENETALEGKLLKKCREKFGADAFSIRDVQQNTNFADLKSADKIRSVFDSLLSKGKLDWNAKSKKYALKGQK
jgi:hypothetical protein